MPAIISAYVVRDLGQFHAKQFFLTGEKVSAQRAYEVGFLTEIAEDEADLGMAIRCTSKRLRQDNGEICRSLVKKWPKRDGRSERGRQAPR